MGIGMLVVVPPAVADQALQLLGSDAQLVGEIVPRGETAVELI
jgi:phosphoribosylaminoimidazole (AIR) synthetase